MADPTNMSSLFQAAFGHYQAGRLQEAQALCRQILANRPNHADAVQLLGLVASANGRHAAAAELIRQAIAMEPDSAHAYSHLGMVLKSGEHFEEAVAAYSKAIALAACFSRSILQPGEMALGSRGRFEDAIAAYGQALAQRPDFAIRRTTLAPRCKIAGEWRRLLWLSPGAPDQSKLSDVPQQSALCPSFFVER